MLERSDYHAVLLIALITFGLSFCFIGLLHASEVHLEVGIQYIEPSSSDCSKAKPEDNCSTDLKDLQWMVVEIDGIVDDMPKSVFEIPATRPTGGGAVTKWFCVKTNTTNLTQFQATVYAEDTSRNRSSPPIVAVTDTINTRRYCGPSAIRPRPEDFRAVN